MSGFYGVVSKKKCVNDVFYGTDYHSHLGTKRAGMVFYNKNDGFRRAIHSLENDYFRSKFEPDLNKFEGNMGLGIISDTDPQPILFNSHMGRFAIVSVSRLVNIAELETYFLNKKGHFTENFQGNVNPTKVVANLICEEEDFVSGIENVEITPEGYKVLKPAREKMQICAFLWVYYGYPPSFYEGINVEEVRYRCGAALAKRDDIKADFVCGIPDSGVGHAIGYGNENGISRRLHSEGYTVKRQYNRPSNGRCCRSSYADRMSSPDLPLRFPQLLTVKINSRACNPNCHYSVRGRREGL